MESNRNKDVADVSNNKLLNNSIKSESNIGFKKRLIVLLLVFAMVLSILAPTATYLMAGAYGSLGTQSQLNQPLLNNSMTADNYNAWETITWGIFLSNFSKPFVDSYRSAFSTGSGYGSQGAGYNQLRFSSGSDQTNQTTIDNWLSLAINLQESTTLKPIQVCYSDMTDGVITPNPILQQAPATSDGEGGVVNDTADTSSSGFRPAQVADLVLQAEGKSEPSTANFDGVEVTFEGWVNWSQSSKLAGQKEKVSGFDDMMKIQEAHLPTFVVQSSNGTVEKVLDYTDSYDLQVAIATLTKALSGEYATEADANLLEFYKSGAQLYLDCFGNIVAKTGDKIIVLVPASVNQHLTSTPKINFVNSVLMNNAASNASADTVMLRGGQDVQSTWEGMSWWQYIGSFFNRNNGITGVPPLNNTKAGIANGSTIVYFDTDDFLLNSMVSGNTHAGKIFLNLYNEGLDSQKRESQLKVDVVNFQQLASQIKDQAAGKTVLNFYTVGTTLSNNLTNNQTTPINDSIYVLQSSGWLEQSVFGREVIVPVKYVPASDKGIDTYGAMRLFVNYIYKVYKGEIDAKQTGYNTVTSDSITALLNSDKCQTTFGVIVNLLFRENSDQLYPSDYLLSFWKYYSTYFPTAPGIQNATFTGSGATKGAALKLLVQNDPSAFVNGTQFSIGEISHLRDAMSYANWQTETKDNLVEERGSSGSFDTAQMYNPYSRQIKYYTQNEVLEAVSKYFDDNEATDKFMRQYASAVYYTYLRFYGIIKSTGVSTDGSEFNKNLFDEKIVSDTSQIEEWLSDTGALSASDKLTAVLDMTYDLMFRNQDRDYSMTDWIYNQYYKIVYSQAQTGTSTTGITTRQADGFLQVHTYDENFLTAWFMDAYAQIVIVLLVLGLAVTAVVSILKRRGIKWALLTVIVLVNVLLIVPSTGELTPWISNELIQNSFSDNLTFWSLSEQIENQNNEQNFYKTNQSNSYINTLSEEERDLYYNLLRQNSSLQLDRQLTLKLDLSRKVIRTDNTNYSELQQLQSARWLLNSIMKQWSADNSEEIYDYMQVSLGDYFEDLSSLYWYYKPMDAVNASTYNSMSTNYTSIDDGGTGFDNLVSNASMMYPDYNL